jgi:lipopolysaccharide export system protein LptA
MLSQNKDGLSRVVLKGNPVHLKQDDENGDPMTATSQNLDYDLVKKIAVLTGNVIITQPRGVMHGERVVYDVGNGVITSGGDGTRVRMHIEPKPANAATDKPKKDKKDKKEKKDKPAAAPASDKNPAKTQTPTPPAKSASGTP